VAVWLYIPLIVVHVTVAIALILIVLLQAGKGAGIGAAFGGASQTVFGPRGPGNFLSKLTTAAAAIFMVTSLVLAIYSAQYVGGSVVLSSPNPKPAGTPPASAPEATPPVTPSAPTPSTHEEPGTTDTPSTPGSTGETSPEQR
jgi:preprotein translocase subunit SecG